MNQGGQERRFHFNNMQPSERISSAKFPSPKFKILPTYRHIDRSLSRRVNQGSLLQQTASYDDTSLASLAPHPVTGDYLPWTSLQHILEDDMARNERQIAAIRDHYSRSLHSVSMAPLL